MSGSTAGSATGNTPVKANLPATVTGIDILKLVAIVAMIADHIGLYFVDNAEFLRVMGRPAALIFGFLIGYSGATRVPPIWVMLGLGLSILELTLKADPAEHIALDILIALALVRITLPWLESAYLQGPPVCAAAALLLAALVPATSYFVEYGGEVALLALAGVARRLEASGPGGRTIAVALALGAGGVASAAAVVHFGFGLASSVAIVVVILATVIWLATFRPDVRPGPGSRVSALIRWCGRHTLGIYAAHVAAFAILRWALERLSVY